HPGREARASRLLVQIEHRGRVATHHLLLVLPGKGPHEFVQGRLSFQPDGAEVREVGAPENLIDAYVWNSVVRRRIADETVPDPGPHVVTRVHLQPGEMKTRDIFVDLVQAGHKAGNPPHFVLATDELQFWETLQDATKDEVIGQHRLDLVE